MDKHKIKGKAKKDLNMKLVGTRKELRGKEDVIL